MRSNRIFKMLCAKTQACQMFRHIFDGKFYSICQAGLKFRITYEAAVDADDDDGWGGVVCVCVEVV